MGLQLSWCDSLQDAHFPAAEYEALRLRVSRSTPFNHLGWQRAAEASLGAGQQLQVLLGYRDGRLCLCLPLMRQQVRFGLLRVPVVRHLGYPLNDRIALLIDLPSSFAGQVLRAIRQKLPHALMQFDEVVGGPDGWQRQWALESSHFARQLSCKVPIHRISESDRQEVNGPPRYKLRRARKRLAACGARERRVVPTVENINEVLDVISRVEQVSWKGTDGVGIFSGDRRQRWMYRAFTALAAHGLVRMVLHEVDGRCISYRLGLLEHGRLYDYNLAFLPEFHELGSGRVLLEEWLRWGLDEGWQWLDASRVSLDNSSHQLHERMTDHIEQWRLNSFSWRLDGICLGLATRCWHWLKPRLRNYRAKGTDKRGKQPTAISDAAS